MTDQPQSGATGPQPKPFHLITAHPNEFLPNDAKKFEMTATYYTFPQPHYEVNTISDTVWYQPGNQLSPAIMADITYRPNWNVKIMGNNLIANIMTILGVINKLPIP